MNDKDVPCTFHSLPHDPFLRLNRRRLRATYLSDHRRWLSPVRDDKGVEESRDILAALCRPCEEVELGRPI